MSTLLATADGADGKDSGELRLEDGQVNVYRTEEGSEQIGYLTVSDLEQLADTVRAVFKDEDGDASAPDLEGNLEFGQLNGVVCALMGIDGLGLRNEDGEMVVFADHQTILDAEEEALAAA